MPQEDIAFVVQDVSSQITYEDVLPNIDFTYAVRPEKVKEEIIINAPTGLTSYHTKIEAPGLTPSLLEDRSVTFQNSQGEEIFGIPTPFMYDREGEQSYDIVVQLEILDDDTCNVIYIPNYDWLQAPERVYPVTLDPTYAATPTMHGSGVTQDAYVDAGYPNSNYYNSIYLKVGGNYRSYLRFPTLPSLSSDYIIQGARIDLAAVSESASNINVYQVTGSWSSDGIKWNNQPSTGSLIQSNIPCVSHYYNISAKNLVAGWYAGKYSNYGIMITSASSSSGTWDLYSSDCAKTVALPGIQVMFYPMHDANLATGTYFIQNYSNNRYLDATSGAAANGTNVETTSFHGNNSQQWYVENYGNGLYGITSNILNGYKRRTHYLDVHGGIDIQVNVNLWNNPNNRYRIRYDNYTDRIAITPSFSNTRALDVYLGEDSSQYNKNVQLYDYKHSNNQM